MAAADRAALQADVVPIWRGSRARTASAGTAGVAAGLVVAFMGRASSGQVTVPRARGPLSLARGSPRRLHPAFARPAEAP